MENGEHLGLPRLTSTDLGFARLRSVTRSVTRSVCHGEDEESVGAGFTIHL